MILIVSDAVPQTIARYRNRVRGITRCRSFGLMDGKPCRIIARHRLGISCNLYPNVTVIWDGFKPTEAERKLVTRSGGID